MIFRRTVQYRQNVLYRFLTMKKDEKLGKSSIRRFDDVNG